MILALVDPAIVVGFILCFWLSIKRSFSPTPAPGRAVWRRNVFALGVAFGFGSALLHFVTGIYARVNGGFPYFDPTLLQIYGYGFLMALVGFVSAFFGNRGLRLAGLVLSFAMLFLWFAAANSEL